MRGLRKSCSRVRVLLLLVAVLLLASPCFAQSVPTQAPATASAPQRFANNLDRSEEDWRFLQDPSQREDFWDPLQSRPLGREGWYLTLAGEIRPFCEIYHNHNWGAGPQDRNGYYLQRFMCTTKCVSAVKAISDLSHHGDRHSVRTPRRARGSKGGRPLHDAGELRRRLLIRAAGSPAALANLQR